MRLKLVAVAVAALGPVLAMLAYNEFAMRSQRNEDVRTQAARQASSEVDRIVEGLHSLLTAVRSMPSVQNLDTEGCNGALKSVAASVPNIRTIFVVDLQGRPICGSRDAPPGATFADRDYFKDVLVRNDFVVGTYTKSRMSDSAVLPVAMPVLVAGKPTAVVSGVLLDWLQNRISERKRDGRGGADAAGAGTGASRQERFRARSGDRPTEFRPV